MSKLGITYEELLEIYAVNGHQVKQPNSVKAIAQALNTIYSRVFSGVMDTVNNRLNEYYNVIVSLERKVTDLQAAAIKVPGPRRAAGPGRNCYCGTFVHPEEPSCPVCKAKMPNDDH